MIFPIICLKEHDKMIYGFSNSKRFHIADNELVQEGVFSSVLIIDSLGNRYEVRSVKVLGWATPFWGYSLLRKGRQVHIEFDLIEKGNVSLVELKYILVDKIQNNPYYYANELLPLMERANNFEAVFKLFY